MSLRRNAVANFLGQGWTTLMGLAFIPVYIQYVGMEAYGLIGVFALLQSWMSLLDLGMTPALSREMARYTAGAHNEESIRDLLRSIEITTVAVASIVAVAIWQGSRWLASDWVRLEKLPVETVAHGLAVMGVVLGLRFVENVYRSSVVGLQRQVTLNAVTGAMATLRAVGAVLVLAWVSPTIGAYFVWQGVVSVFTLFLFATIVHQTLPRGGRRARFSSNALRGIWRFAAGTMLVSLLGFILSQADKLILSKLLTLQAFALYTLAYTLASAVRLLTQPVDQAIFPRLAQLHQRDESGQLGALYHKATQYNAVLMGGVGVFLAVFGERVLTLWLRDAELARNTHVVLSVLVVGMVLNAIMNGPYYLQMAAGWTGLLVKVNAVMVVVFVPLIFVLTKRYEMIGAASAWVLLNLTYVVTVARLMHRRLLQGQLRDWYLRDLFAPLSIAVAVALLFRWLVPLPTGTLSSIVLLSVILLCIVGTAALAASAVRGDVAVHLRRVLTKYA